MRLEGVESDQRIFTKKIRGIDMTTAGVAAQAILSAFVPTYPSRWYMKAAYCITRAVTGVISQQPTITIDNGTNGQNLVANFNVNETQGAFLKLTNASSTLLIDSTVAGSGNLRIQSIAAAIGATTFLVDIIFEFMLVDLPAEAAPTPVEPVVEE